MLVLSHVGIAQRCVGQAELLLMRHLAADEPPLWGRKQQGDCSFGILSGLNMTKSQSCALRTPDRSLLDKATSCGEKGGHNITLSASHHLQAASQGFLRDRLACR